MVATELLKVEHETEWWARASAWPAPTTKEINAPGSVTADPARRPSPSVPERAARPRAALGTVVSGEAGALAAPPRAMVPGRIVSMVGTSVMIVLAVLLGGQATQEDAAMLSVTRMASTQRTSVLTEAAWPPEVLDALRRIVIQRDGRLESFGRFAGETVAFVTGRVRVGDQDPVQTLFSMMAQPDAWRGLSLIQVPARSVRARLGMAREAPRISLSELTDPRASRAAPALTDRQHRDHRWAGRGSLDVRARGRLLQDLLAQRLHLVPPLPGAGSAWLLLLEPDGYGTQQQIGLKRAWGTLLIALRGGDPEVMRTAAARLTALLRNLRYPTARLAAAGGNGYARALPR